METSYGKCDIEGCGKTASMYTQYGDGRQERLCSEHNAENVKRANLETYKTQEQQRAILTEGHPAAVPIVIEVSQGKNLDGYYTAGVANPINSCDVGFGASPARALKDLGIKLSENADVVLQQIREHESEWRFLEREFANQENR